MSIIFYFLAVVGFIAIIILSILLYLVYEEWRSDWNEDNHSKGYWNKQ